MKMKIFLSLGIMVTLVQLVLGKTEVDVRFDSFHGDGLLWDGGSCEFHSECDPEFHICFRQPDSSSSTCDFVGLQETLSYDHVNSVVFGNAMNGVANPVSFLTSDWKGGFIIDVKVFDDDVRSSDLIDKFLYSFSLLGNPPGKTSSEPIKIELKGERENAPKTTLIIQIKVFCVDHHYGPTCDIFCEGQNSDTGGHYSCHPDTGEKICHYGWESPEVNCLVWKNDCEHVVCEHGGHCVDGYQSFSCVCLPGFNGTHCQHNIDDCAEQPCEHEGECEDLVDDFRCTCPPQWLGKTCSLPACHADFIDCNRGSCYFDELKNGTACLCEEGFKGEKCEVDICDYLDCNHDAPCVHGSCICPSGYTGQTCDVSLCYEVTCHNGGVCDGGECTCPPGFTGRSCENDIEDCRDDTCSNNGLCEDAGVNEVKCLCQDGFSGTFCEIRIDPTPWLPQNETKINEDDQLSPEADEDDVLSDEKPDENKGKSKLSARLDIALAACSFVVLAVMLVTVFYFWHRYRKSRRVHPGILPDVRATFKRGRPSYGDDANKFNNPLYDTVRISVISSGVPSGESSIPPPQYTDENPDT